MNTNNFLIALLLLTTLHLYSQNISNGRSYSTFLCESGDVYSAGQNLQGQLGNGTLISSNIPILLDGSIKYKYIASGAIHGLGVQSNGTLWGWGNNESGQLGQRSTEFKKSIVPVKIESMNNVKVVASGSSTSFAIKNDGTVWSWGANTEGQLGNGVGAGYSHVPTQIKGLHDIISIDAETNHVMALKEDGTIYGWGQNVYGELGTGTTRKSEVPVEISGHKNFIDVAVGSNHTIAAKEDGSVWTWGNNDKGQLGNGTLQDKQRPTFINNLDSVIDVAAGHRYSAVLKADGTVWTWGLNVVGQLGIASSLDHSTVPVQVVKLNNVVSISSSFDRCLAIKEDGTVWGWGGNRYGQIGDGSNSNAYVPVKVMDLCKVSTSNMLEVDKNVQMNVYPNPYTNDLTIEFNQPQKDILISVFNLTGVEVFKGKYNNKKKTQIDIESTIPSGIYYMFIKINGSGVDYRKIVKL